MKTNKNVKGFTLVELIVVIAIIGVLAAILVPSMLGYVKKANISAANSNAKTVYNAAATACADCDTAGISLGSGSQTLDLGSGTSSATSSTFTYYFMQAIGNPSSISEIHVKLTDGAAVGTYCKKGNYYGAYPTATTESNATSTPSL